MNRLLIPRITEALKHRLEGAPTPAEVAIPQLHALGFKIKAGATDEEVCAAIMSILEDRIRWEVEKDETGRGYAGKPPDDIARLLNSEHTPIVSTEVLPPRLEQLFYPRPPPAGTFVELMVGPHAQIIKDELLNDPTGRGYKDHPHDPAKVFELLTGPMTVHTLHHRRHGPRWSQIAAGVPFAPSNIDTGDVADALGVTGG